MGVLEASIQDSGEARLAALGYKQELKRDFNLFTNFAVSFSIISILTGVTGSFNLAWLNGGPVSMVWGWVGVSIFTMTVAIGMAEIVSALPSSGGPYFWAAHLATKKYSPFAAWMTGYINLLGQIAVTAGIEFSLTNQIVNMVLLQTGYVFQQSHILGIYTACLVIHALINSSTGRILAFLSGLSVVWHVAVTFLIIIVLPAVAPVRQSAQFVFTTFYSVDYQQATGTSTGIMNNGYLFLMGILMSQFTLTGFDACAHMSEETTSADKSAPVAIIMSVFVSAVIGFAYILALLFSIQDPTQVMRNNYGSGQIMVDAFTARFGSGGGGIALMGLAMMAMFFCGMSSLTSNSRMLWSFSRDRAVPGHQLWSKVAPRTKTPINAVWFCATIAFLLGLPMLDSAVAFAAVVSISTIGLYISYGIPIFICLINHRQFEPGPFNLGLAGRVISAMAVLWILFISAVFVSPTSFPVTSVTLNYTPVALGIVLVFALGWWFFPYKGARTWYRGEHHTIEDFTVHQRELQAQHQAEQGKFPEHGQYPGNDDSAHSGMPLTGKGY